MQYRLIVVHAAYSRNTQYDEPSRSFQSTFKEFIDLFCPNQRLRPIELTRNASSDQNNQELMLAQYNPVPVYSEDGFFNTEKSLSEVVLTGPRFDVCHLNAFSSVCDQGAEEIHIPLDLITLGDSESLFLHLVLIYMNTKKQVIITIFSYMSLILGLHLLEINHYIKCKK